MVRIVPSRAAVCSLREARRVLNVNFKPVELKVGTQEIALECVEPGVVGLDYVWAKRSWRLLGSQTGG